jgi:hypothetical protein
MPAAAAITTIGATQGSEFIAHEMFAARPAMAASAKYAYLVNKIAFLHELFFARFCKYIMSLIEMNGVLH